MLGVDGVGDRRSWAFVARHFSGKTRKHREKEKGAKTEEEKKRGKQESKKEIQTAELNCREQVTATNSWPSSLRREGKEVDNQVAAPNESSTPKLYRATIAQQRVRMAGWRQERLGSRAGTHWKKEKDKTSLILTGLLMEGVTQSTFE
jgi:hypothetical protein